ncbi:MAG TPA: ATP-binding protein [Anaeromyxobacter sp.]|nr:ATP-binding protein [Anaeromyxobacter sp.]
MNLAAAIAIASAALSFGVGLMSLRISRAPGSGDQRWFSVVAFASAAYSLCNLGTTLALSAPLVVWMSRVQVATVMLNLWGWIAYSSAFLRRRPARWERAAGTLLVVGALFALVPRAVFQDVVVDRAYPALGVVYRSPLTTTAGDALMAVLLVAATFLLVRFVRAAGAGVPHARVVAAAFGAFVAFGAVDALATAGADLPFVLDTGVAIPVLAMGWVITSRFVASGNELDALRRALLVEVEARTKDLATALEALHQQERLAALGQFANGVAHEVNSPAAVVAASLRYLADASAAGRFPPDGAEVIDDALAAMKRINDLVRKLVDAGRVAAAPSGVSMVSIAGVVAKAAAEARARGAGRIEVVEAAPPDLAVRARRESLEQVIAILVANAVEAIPRERPGRIEIRAERAGPMVRVTVRDDGAGMSSEVLRRAFDPFFTTKPGGGAGLGLPVARGIVEAVGGAAWLESEPGVGTTAIVDLPEAVEPPPHPA